MEKVRIGVIGVGNMGMSVVNILAAEKECPEITMTAVCDIDEGRRQWAADACEGTFITSTGEFPGTNRLEIVGSKGKLVLEEGKLKWWRLSQDEQEFRFNAPKGQDKMPCEYEEFSQEEGVSAHQRILQNFADHILHGAQLIAPGYDGIYELMLQNAAYLSSWTGNVPVSIPFDERLYDELLARHRAGASASNLGSNHPDNEYKKRWQIEW